MRARSFLTLFAAICAIAALPASASAASPVQPVKLNASAVKASAKSLTVKNIVFASTDRAAVLLNGSVTFKSGRRSIRATVIEVTITPAWSQFSAKLGKARYTLFSTSGPIALDQANGVVASGNLALKIGGGARSAVNKALGLKGVKRLKSSRAGSVKFAIGTPPPPPPPPPPAPPAPPAPPQPPVAEIVTGPQGLVADNTASFTFVADQTATFMCALDDATPAACTSPQTYFGLADGAHSFRVHATNANGTGATASRSFTVDITPPAVNIDLGSAPFTTSSRQIEIAASEPASFKCSLNNATPAPCSANHNVEGMVNGDNDFLVSATDAAGNSGSAWVNIHIDLNVTLCGTLTEDRTLDPTEATVYMVTCDLKVAEGTDLTVAPNTILKFAAGKKLVVDGSLEVNGAFMEEAVFTSAKDDQIGGDSNGDGGNTDPIAGDWGGIVARPGSDSSLDMFRARIRYATTGVKSQKGAADAMDFNLQQNWFQNVSADAISFTAAGSPAPPTITDNDFDGSIGGNLLVVDSPAIDQSLIGPNIGPLDKPWVISGTLVGDGDFDTNNTIASRGITIAPGAELELDGDVWKFAAGGGLHVRGKLKTTSANDTDMTYFTSANDDLGADSPWPGPSPAAGDWRGIYTTPGDDAVIDIAYARVLYAETGISSVKHAGDFSTFKVVSTDVRWASEAGVEYSIGDSTAASPAPTLNGVYVDTVDGPAFTIDSPKIDQTKLNNLFTNEVRGPLRLSGKLVGDGPLDTNLIPIADGLEIAEGARLEIQSPEPWKFAINTALTVNGTLEVNGQDGSEPTFTSERDDLYMDSNADGSATTPATGDWRGIKAGTSPSAEIDIDNLRIQFAQTAVDRPAASNPASFSVAHAYIRDVVTGIRFVATSNSATPTIEDNYFDDVTGDGITLNAPNVDQQKLWNNNATTPDTPMRLAGALTGNGELRTPMTKVINGLTVASGSTLVMATPDTWTAAGNKSLNVKGTLVVSPPDWGWVQITSPSQWNGIVVSDGGVLSAARLFVRNASTGVALFNGAAYMQQSRIESSNIGIDAYNNSFASYNGTLPGLSIGARTDASSTIMAPNTWWGAGNGPAPSGSGSPVIGDVTFAPYLFGSP